MSISSGTATFGAGGTYATLSAAWADIATLTGDLTLLQVGDSLEPAVSVGGSGARKSLAGHQLLFDSTVDPDGDPAGGWLITCLSWSPQAIGNGVFGIDHLNIITTNGVQMATAVGAPSSGSGNGQFARNSLLRATVARALSMGNVTAAYGAGATGTYSLYNVKMKGVLGGFQFFNGTLNNEPHMRFIAENCAAAATDAAGAPFTVQTRADNSLLQFSMKNLVAWVDLPAGTAKPISLSGMSGADKAAYQALILASAANGGNADGVTYAYGAITTPADIISLSESDPDWLESAQASALYTNGVAPALAGNPYNVAPYPIGIPGPYVPPPPSSGSDCWMPVFIPGF